MSRPLIFISYSHKDEETWKDPLVRQLSVAQQQGLLELWDDRRIDAGENWFEEIIKAIEDGCIAILLVSENSLTSQFILNQEVPRMLNRLGTGKLKLYPIIVEPCDWGAVEWLKQMNLRPRDGRPVGETKDKERTKYQISLDLLEIAKEIRQLIETIPTSPKTTFERPKTLQPKFGPSLLSENYLAIKEEVGKLDDFTDLYYQTDTWLNKLTALGKKIDEVNKEINKQPTPLGKKFEETSKEITDKSRVMEDVRRAIRLITGEEGLISKFDEAFDEISGQLKTFTDSINDLTQKQKELDKVILRLASGIVGIMNQEKIENLRQIKRSLHSICSDVGIKLDEYENEPVSTEALENHYIKIRSIFQGLKNSLLLNDLRRAPESLRLSLYEEIRGSVKILTTLTAMSKEVQQQ